MVASSSSINAHDYHVFLMLLHSIALSIISPRIRLSPRTRQDGISFTRTTLVRKRCTMCNVHATCFIYHNWQCTCLYIWNILPFQSSLFSLATDTARQRFFGHPLALPSRSLRGLVPILTFSSSLRHYHLHPTSRTVTDLEIMSDQVFQETQLVVIGGQVTRRGNRRAGPVSARMGLAAFLLVVEALYQSADACPPLKSAVGAIMAIVTLCEVWARKIFSSCIILTAKL